MEYFVTGTQAYGPVTSESDLDIVVMQCDRANFISELKRLGIETNTVLDYKLPTLYFNFLGILFNVVWVEDSYEFNKWKERTEKMRKLPHFHNKAERVCAFNSI